VILDAFTRHRAHTALRRLTSWDDLTIDRARRDRRPLKADSVIIVNTAGVAAIAAGAAWKINGVQS
jgi:hypothetical protein